jgi:mRNA-degrading endonuclease toxin of MazEF toxin-antitoxin module
MLSKSLEPEYTQGEIVWADYPLSDKPAKSKVRSVLVISNASSNTLDNDLLILPITSRIRSQLFEIVLTEGMTTIALPAVSAVRCNKLHTIRNTRIIGKIAAVTPTALAEIVETVYQAINLSDGKSE